MKDINIIRQETRDLIKQKFSEINFIEEGHKYFIGEKEYTPVSNIIKCFFLLSIFIVLFPLSFTLCIYYTPFYFTCQYFFKSF